MIRVLTYGTFDLLHYGHIRLLKRAKECLLYTSAILHEEREAELKRLVEFYDYLEIQPLINNRFLIEGGHVKDEEALREINRKIIALGEQYGKPVVATCDAHYFDAEEALYRRIITVSYTHLDVYKRQHQRRGTAFEFPAVAERIQ